VTAPGPAVTPGAALDSGVTAHHISAVYYTAARIIAERGWRPGPYSIGIDGRLTLRTAIRYAAIALRRPNPADRADAAIDRLTAQLGQPVDAWADEDGRTAVAVVTMLNGAARHAEATDG
jgi:hypothetical protein